MEENDSDSDDADFRLVFTALNELKLASRKPFFKQHFLQDETLFYMQSEEELRKALTTELQPGLPFGLAFKFSRLWFKKYHVNAEALSNPTQRKANDNDSLQAPQQEEKSHYTRSEAETAASEYNNEEKNAGGSKKSRELETRGTASPIQNEMTSSERSSDEWMAPQGAREKDNSVRKQSEGKEKHSNQPMPAEGFKSDWDKLDTTTDREDLKGVSSCHPNTKTNDICSFQLLLQKPEKASCSHSRKDEKNNGGPPGVAGESIKEESVLCFQDNTTSTVSERSVNEALASKIKDLIGVQHGSKEKSCNPSILLGEIRNISTSEGNTHHDSMGDGNTRINLREPFGQGNHSAKDISSDEFQGETTGESEGANPETFRKENPDEDQREVATFGTEHHTISKKQAKLQRTLSDPCWSGGKQSSSHSDFTAKKGGRKKKKSKQTRSDQSRSKNGDKGKAERTSVESVASMATGSPSSTDHARRKEATNDIKKEDGAEIDENNNATHVPTDVAEPLEVAVPVTTSSAFSGEQSLDGQHVSNGFENGLTRETCSPMMLTNDNVEVGEKWQICQKISPEETPCLSNTETCKEDSEDDPRWVSSTHSKRKTNDVDGLQLPQREEKQSFARPEAKSTSHCMGSNDEKNINGPPCVIGSSMEKESGGFSFQDNTAISERSVHEPNASQNEDLAGVEEKRCNQPILVGTREVGSILTSEESKYQDSTAGQNNHSAKERPPDEFRGDTTAEREVASLVTDINQEKNHDENQSQEDETSETEYLAISMKEADPSSSREGERTSNQTFSSENKGRTETTSRQAESDQSSTTNEDRDRNGRASMESLALISTGRLSSTDQTKLENELAEAMKDDEKEDGAEIDKNINATDSPTDVSEPLEVAVAVTTLSVSAEDQSLDGQDVLNKTEFKNGLTRETSSSYPEMQISWVPGNDDAVAVGEKKTLCQGSLPEEKHCAYDTGDNTGDLPEDSEEVVRCTPRLLGVKGRDTSYPRGCVLDAEENREVEFKKMTGAPSSTLPWKIMEKARKFICGCLNADKKGIIYFGVGDCQEKELKHKRGEVLGLQVESVMDDIVKAFQCVLDDHIESDAGPLQKGGEQNCVNLEFVPVTSQGNRTSLYVIEIEVVRDWKFCKDNIYYSKSWTEKRGAKNDKDPVSKKALSDFYKVHKDEFDDIAIRTNGASNSVKKHEVNRQVKEPLLAKYKEWKRETKFGASGSLEEINLDDADHKRLNTLVRERLRDLNFKEFAYILIANKLNPKFRGTPSLSFLQNVPWVAVFDLFDPASKKDGLHYVCNETTDAPRAKNRTLHDLNEVSSNGITDEDCPFSTRGTTWIFNSEEMEGGDWITRSKDCMYRALSAYNSRFLGRLSFVFLGLGENAVPEMADIMESCFSILGGESASKNVTIISESRPVAEALIKASKPPLRKHLRECSVEIPWGLLKEVVREMVGPNKFKERGATTELPFFTGKKEVLNKVIHSWVDLEVYSPNPQLSSLAEDIEKARDAFYKGGQVSQINLFHNHSIQRTLEEKISRKIDQALKTLSKPSSDLKCHVKTVVVPYEPGSGVTTMCRRILWNKRLDYRCAVVKAITSVTDYEIEELQSVAYDDKNMKYSHPVLVLVDNYPEIDTRRLTERLVSREKKCVLLSTFPVAKSSPNSDFDIKPLRQLDGTETSRVKNILINITSDSGRRKEAEKVLEREKRFIWFGLELFGRDYVKIEERLQNHISSTMMDFLGDSQGIHEMLLNFCCLLHFYSNGRAILPHPVICDFLYKPSEKTNEQIAFRDSIHKIFGGLLLEDFNETNGYSGWRPAHSLVSEVVKSRICVEDTAILLLEKVQEGRAYVIKFLQQQVFQVFLDRKKISDPTFRQALGTGDDDAGSDLETDVLGVYEVRTRYSPLISDILEGENGIPRALKLLIEICEKAEQTDYKAYAWQQLARFMGYEMSSKEMDIKDALHRRLHAILCSHAHKEIHRKLPMPEMGIEAAHIAVDIAINHQPSYSHHYVTKGVLYLLQLRDFKPAGRPNLICSMPDVIDICHKAQEVYDKALATKNALNYYPIIGKIQAIVLLLQMVKGLPCFPPEGDAFARYLKKEEVPRAMKEVLSQEQHNFVQNFSSTTLDLLNQLFRDVKFRQLTTHDENEMRGLTSAHIRASMLRRKFYETTGFDRSELTDVQVEVHSSPMTKDAPAVYQQMVQDVLFKHEETPYSWWSNLDDRDVSSIYNLLKGLCLRGHGSHEGMLIFSRACLRLKERPSVDELDNIVSKWVGKFPDSEWAHLFNYMIHFPIPNGSLAAYNQSTKASIKKCDSIVREKTGWRARKSGAQYLLGKGKGLNAIVSSKEFPGFEKQWASKTHFWRSKEISDTLERVRGQKDVNFKGVINYHGIQLRFDNNRYPNESKDDLWFYVGFTLAGPYAYDPVDNDTFAILKRIAEENASLAFSSCEASYENEASATSTTSPGRGKPHELRRKSTKQTSLAQAEAIHSNIQSHDIQGFSRNSQPQASISIGSSLPVFDAFHRQPADAPGPFEDSSSSSSLSPLHPQPFSAKAESCKSPCDNDTTGTFTVGLGRGIPHELRRRGTKQIHLLNTEAHEFQGVSRNYQQQAPISISSSMPVLDAFHCQPDIPGAYDDTSFSLNFAPFLAQPFSASADILQQPSTPSRPSYASALQRGHKGQTSKDTAGLTVGGMLSTKKGNEMEGVRGNQRRKFQPKYVDEKGIIHHGSMVLGAYKSKECQIHKSPSCGPQITSKCSFAHAWRGDTLQHVCTKCTRELKRVCRERKTHQQFIWNLGPYRNEDGDIWKEPRD